MARLHCATRLRFVMSAQMLPPISASEWRYSQIGMMQTAVAPSASKHGIEEVSSRSITVSQNHDGDKALTEDPKDRDHDVEDEADLGRDVARSGERHRNAAVTSSRQLELRE